MAKPIKIKKSKEGTFTAWATENGFASDQEAATHVMANKDKYSPDIVKKANFARNAAHWNNKPTILKKLAGH